MELDVTPYLPVAFANGELTAADILNIEEIEIVIDQEESDEELEPTETVTEIVA